MKYLIKCEGFIGDILFASSIAKKLHEQDSEAIVDYFIPLVQPIELLHMNPYIQCVFTEGAYENIEYDQVAQMPRVNQAIPATIQFQQMARVQNPTTEFDIYTVPAWDSWAKYFLSELGKMKPGVPIVGYDVAWKKKAYNTREEQILRGVGGEHRDIDWMMNEMRKEFIMLPIGLEGSIMQRSPEAQNPSNYSMTASLVKHCDWMIGCEGGLTNLAAGLHTRTVITSDFIYQLYGPHGLFRPCADPKMGPKIYYPNDGHVQLDPWITDEEVLTQLIAAIKGA